MLIRCGGLCGGVAGPGAEEKFEKEGKNPMKRNLTVLLLVLALALSLVSPAMAVESEDTSASANAEGLSTSMTSTMREGNQRAGHLGGADCRQPGLDPPSHRGA